VRSPLKLRQGRAFWEGKAVIALKNILVPTDFSEPSEVALRYARALAEAFGASLHLLHVLDEGYLAWAASEGFASPMSADVRGEAEKSAEGRLQRMMPEAERQQYRARLVVLTGTPFVEVVRYARDQSIDLIVMGTHGRGVIAHLLMGSVAERVVRKAPCPVLTVKHPEHEFVLP
jgi:nucleotide-binding universal stress UspA family protein